MKIVVFGLAISSSWGNGHATLWRGLCRALDELGHRVVFFERDVPYYSIHRDMSAVAGCELVLYTEWAEAEARVEQELGSADVAIVTSYCPDGIEATERILTSGRAMPVFYDLDTPVTLSRLQLGETTTYIGSDGLKPFSLVLSYTGGAALDGLRDLGARNVAPLYGHVDPSVHNPGSPVSEFDCDLAYLGTFAADRQDALNELFLKPADRNPTLRFLIAGAQYPADFPWAQNVYFVRHLPPAQHPDFYASCRLTLNVTREAMARMGWCPSGRLFEAAACGAAILSDRWEGLDAFFEPGVEILTASTTAEVTAAMSLTDAEIGRIRRAARERVLAEHTSKARAMQLMELLSSARHGDALMEKSPAMARC